MKIVNGFPGYYADENGDVWTRRPPNGRGDLVDTPRKLKQSPNPCGYLTVTLCRGGTKHTKMVHRIIAEAFLGPCPDDMECCHANGIRTDNRVINLRWDTTQANINDRGNHGKTKRGEGASWSKLTAEKVIEARDRYANGEGTQRELARQYGVAQSSLGKALRGKSWGHVARKKPLPINVPNYQRTDYCRGDDV